MPLILNFHSVAPEIAHSEAPQCLSLPAASLALLEEAYEYDSSIQSLLGKAPEKNTLYSEVLTLQNRKINTLAQLILSAQNDNKANGSDMEITESGVTFNTTESLIPGRFINIELFAPTAGVNLLAFAQVTHSKNINERLVRLSTRFHRLTETQRQQLTKLL